MEKTILIVDDEPNIVISLEYLMEKEGFTVIKAYDGQEALDYLQDSIPDLILLDVMMPNIHGFEVCKKVRCDDRLKDIPIIMLTAKGREAEMNKGLTLGANAYITKPFSTHDLVKRVTSLLGA